MASSTRTPASLSELFRSITKPPTRQLPNTTSDFIMMALILSCVLLHASPLCAAMKRAADGDDPNCGRSQRHCPGCGNVRAGGNNSSSASALAASTLVAELSDVLPANAVNVPLLDNECAGTGSASSGSSKGSGKGSGSYISRFFASRRPGGRDGGSADDVTNASNSRTRPADHLISSPFSAEQLTIIFRSLAIAAQSVQSAASHSREAASQACDASQALPSCSNCSWHKGKAKGFEKGWGKGKDEGEGTGFAKGWETGNAEGKGKGFNKGWEKGWDEGRGKGFAKGWAKGSRDLMTLVNQVSMDTQDDYSVDSAHGDYGDDGL